MEKVYGVLKKSQYIYAEDAEIINAENAEQQRSIYAENLNDLCLFGLFCLFSLFGLKTKKTGKTKQTR